MTNYIKFIRYHNFYTWIINIRNAIENVNAEIGEN